MKKQIIIAVFVLGAFLFGTVNAQAQTATTNVNLILADVISIDSGVAVSGIVDFSYTTSADYNSSKSVIVPESLVITSSTNFNVNVKADGLNFINGSNIIPVNVLQIKAATGGTMNGTFNDITLSTTNQKLVSIADKGAQKSLSIQYTISADNASKVLLGKPAGTYTQTVTYTATAL